MVAWPLPRRWVSAFAASCETGFIRITSPEVADDCVRKAFYLAKLESRPIMLSAPMDVQQMAFEDDDEPYKPSSTVLPKRVVHPDTTVTIGWMKKTTSLLSSIYLGMLNDVYVINDILAAQRDGFDAATSRRAYQTVPIQGS